MKKILLSIFLVFSFSFSAFADSTTKADLNATVVNPIKWGKEKWHDVDLEYNVSAKANKIWVKTKDGYKHVKDNVLNTSKQIDAKYKVSENTKKVVAKTKDIAKTAALVSKDTYNTFREKKFAKKLDEIWEKGSIITEPEAKSDIVNQLVVLRDKNTTTERQKEMIDYRLFLLEKQK